MVTQNDVGAALKAIKAIADTIKDAGSIPAGHLYAALMPAGCTLARFEQVIGMLERGGLVRREQSGLLVWIG